MRRVRSWVVVAVVVVVLFTRAGWLSRGWGGARAAAAALVPAEPAGRERGGVGPTDGSPTRAEASFATVIDRVRGATAPGAKEQDWGEPALWEALAGLVGRVKDASGRADFDLPVEWPDVKKVVVGLPPPQEAEAGTLYVCRGGSVGRARHTVILADGSLQIQHAEQCVIIARGAVLIIHGTGNVVLAGRHIEVGFDGDPGAGMRRPPPPRGNAPAARLNAPRPGGSLLVSGGTIFVAHASDTVCSAPQAVRMSHAHSSTFLNSPNVPAARPDNFPVRPGEEPEVMRSLEAGDLGPLVPRQRPNPLEGKVKVTDVVSGGVRGFAVVEEGGLERVVRPGADLVPGGQAAAAVPAEKGGWKLVAVGDRFAVFSDGADDAAFLLSER